LSKRISDGGAALIVTTRERAQDFPKAPVYVIAGAQQTGLRLYQNDDQLMRGTHRLAAAKNTRSAGRKVGRRA